MRRSPFCSCDRGRAPRRARPHVIDDEPSAAFGSRPLARRALLVGCAAAALLQATAGQAEEMPVPAAHQAELLSKVAAYDKALPTRAGDRVRVLLLSRPLWPESESGAAQLHKAISQLADIGGMPYEATIIQFTTADELAALCRSKRAAVIYVTPGFGGEIAAITKALTGVDVLTVSALAHYVPKGIVLGFDLVSGKTRLLVNLTQAKAQKVAFRPELLKLAKIYE